jgi:hypothetical protein
MAYHPLRRFDPSANYVATRPFLLEGTMLEPGSPIPPGTPERLIRKLYDIRKVVVAPQPVEVASAADAPKRKAAR